MSWGKTSVWDRGRKLFSSTKHPDLLGYCGYAFLASQALSTTVDALDAGLVPRSTDPRERFDAILESLTKSGAGYPLPSEFQVVYATRVGEGMTATFHVFDATLDRGGKPIVRSHLTPKQSSLVVCLGSGTKAFTRSLDGWASSDAGGTSRAVFSAFCDALRDGADKTSGGPPQLIGLYRKGPGRIFGIVWDDVGYYLGTEVSSDNQRKSVRWHNSLFEIVDYETKRRARGAQSQPRPTKLSRHTREQ